jgi:hypothetical protein
MRGEESDGVERIARAWALWPSVDILSGNNPATDRAERRNLRAALMLPVALGRVSTKVPW